MKPYPEPLIFRPRRAAPMPEPLPPPLVSPSNGHLLPLLGTRFKALNKQGTSSEQALNRRPSHEHLTPARSPCPGGSGQQVGCPRSR
jgi:hypothetical protein